MRFISISNEQATTMRTNCCNVPVDKEYDFMHAGHWISCNACGASLAFVSLDDAVTVQQGNVPVDDNPLDINIINAFAESMGELEYYTREDSVLVELTTFNEFIDAVREIQEEWRDLVFNAWEDAVVIGDGTQMVDGEWKPTGFLGALEAFDKKEDPQSED
jgi:hypothetical protein